MDDILKVVKTCNMIGLERVFGEGLEEFLTNNAYVLFFNSFINFLMVIFNFFTKT